jgi:hypothetical protein
MAAMNQRDADFFRPLWRRVAVTGVVAAWWAYEVFFSHEQMWIAITSVGLLYCAWNFFLRFPKDPPAAPPGSTGGGTPPAASSGSPDASTDSSSPPAAPKA